jgi:transposase
VGETPVLRVPLTRDHLSAIGALTPEGRLFMHVQEHSYKGEEVVRFLRQLLRQIPGKLLVVWDGSPIHRCEAVKVFLRQGGGERIHLERLPAYAPELNPKARVWNLFKRRELKNLCCKDLAQLENALLLARARLRHRKQTLRHCFVHAGYSL